MTSIAQCTVTPEKVLLTVLKMKGDLKKIQTFIKLEKSSFQKVYSKIGSELSMIII